MTIEETYEKLWGAMRSLRAEAKWMYNVGCDVKAERLNEKANGIELALIEFGRASGLHICPRCYMLGKRIRLEDDPYESRCGAAFICEQCYEDYGPFDVVEAKTEP